jgi:GT2 family glycosyltransferase
LLISIIIPIIRPEKAGRCIEAILKNAGIDRSLYEIITEEDTKRIGAPKMVKKMTDSCKGDLVCFLGDDTIPGKDFLKHAVDVMETLPDGWGLVGFDDNVRLKGQMKSSAHWLADRRLLPLLGSEFFHTGYWHCWCDNELSLRCTELGRYVFCEEAYIYHDHPIVDPGSDDPDYRRVYSDEWLAHDVILFRKRKRNNWQTQEGHDS